MNCFNCKAPKRYKCKTCRIPYCSITCYKEHQGKCQGPSVAR